VTTATRPQYHRLQRILEMVREGTRTGSLPNCGHFTRELEVSRRTLTPCTAPAICKPLFHNNL
jgi:hypothetical protein